MSVFKLDLQFISCIYGGYRRRVSIWSLGAHLSTKCARANHCSFIGIFSSAPCSVRTKNKQRKSTTKIDVFENMPAAGEMQLLLSTRFWPSETVKKSRGFAFQVDGSSVQVGRFRKCLFLQWFSSSIQLPRQHSKKYIKVAVFLSEAPFGRRILVFFSYVSKKAP